MDSIIKDKIVTYLTEEKIGFKLISDDETDFHILIEFPDSRHRMDVLQPLGKSDMIVIVCITTISPAHLSKLNKLNNIKKEQFLMDLRFLINSFPVDFELILTKNILTEYVISDQIFLDGLSKDKFIKVIKMVFKTKLQAMWEIQKKLGIPSERDTASNEVMYG